MCPLIRPVPLLSWSLLVSLGPFGLSRSLLVSLGHSRSLSVSLGPYRSLSVSLSPSRSFSVSLDLSWSLPVLLGLYQSLLVSPGLSRSDPCRSIPPNSANGPQSFREAMCHVPVGNLTGCKTTIFGRTTGLPNRTESIEH